MEAGATPPTGTCDLTTIGRKSGQRRRVEIWYVTIDDEMVITGTPGARSWLANLRACSWAILHLRRPDRDVEVTAAEVLDPAKRRHITAEAFRLQPWYAEQPYSLDDWVADAPMVVLTAAESENATPA